MNSISSSMTHATPGEVRPGASQVLAERAAMLGVLLWTCDVRGDVLPDPSTPAALRPWAEDPAVQARVATLARSADSSGASSAPVVELAPGWHAALLGPAPGGRPGDGRCLVGSFFDPSFAPPAQAGGDAPDAVRQLAGRVVRPAARAFEVLRWSTADLARSARDQATIRQFSEKLVQAYEEVNLLFRLARLMNAVSEPSQALETICGQIQEILPFRWTAVRLHPSSSRLPGLACRLVVAGRPPLDPGRLEALSGSLLGNWRAGDDWTALLLPGRDELATAVGSEVVAEPIAHEGVVVGALLAGNKGGDDPDVSSEETLFLDAAADFLGMYHENLLRFADQRDLFLGTLRALTAAIDAKDPYTCGHSERVALLACRMASALGMPDAEAERYRIAGLVHDVGKIGVPGAVLCKPGRLTDAEFELIKKHPEIGHHILEGIPLLADVLPGVLHHHERWDGRGYPRRVAGADIPLIARVLALADTFDAMSSNRAYRPALPRDKVLAEFDRCAGTQFDAALVPTFVKLDFAEFDRMVARSAAQAPAASPVAAAVASAA